MTHFSAQIKMPGHYFAFGGVINNENMLVLANNGTTPYGNKIAALQPLADQIRAALEKGHGFETKTATIWPENRNEQS